HLPRFAQQQIIDKKLRLFVIDASKVAREAGLRSRTNTVLQTCFFAISGVLPREAAIQHIKEAIRKTYSGKGEAVVRQNYQAVDQTLADLYEVIVPKTVTSSFDRRHVSVRYCRVGETQYRGLRAGMGIGPVRPVRSVQLRVPAQRDPRQVL